MLKKTMYRVVLTVSLLAVLISLASCADSELTPSLAIAPTETPQTPVSATDVVMPTTTPLAPSFVIVQSEPAVAVEVQANATAAKPTETPIPLLVYLDEPVPPTPTVVPVTPTPASLPDEVKGKILFLTDRFKVRPRDRATVLAMDPDGGRVAKLTNRWVYDRALELDRISPDGSQVLFVKKFGKTYELWLQNTADGWPSYLFGQHGINYEPAWSPDGVHIAFVSPDFGKNDEIYVLNKDTGEAKPVTRNEWEWDKHPSFAPDGSKIVFWSNRETGHQQIWVMNPDGTNPVNISNHPYNDWDPVWVK